MIYYYNYKINYLINMILFLIYILIYNLEKLRYMNKIYLIKYKINLRINIF